LPTHWLSDNEMKAKIITLFCLFCIIFALTGCTQSTWLYRVNIQQGNIITPDMIQNLRVGMTKEAVCELLGTPVLTDTFNDNRWSYIFTFKPSRGKYLEKTLILYFKNDRLCRFRTNHM
jgi:outer membrane protein assembly factor BamE